MAILKKKANSFNDYTLDLSFGELQAIMGSLQHDHADPVADELNAALTWYCERVPGPGEDEEDVKAREDGEVKPDKFGSEAEEGDMPIPMPPGTENGAEEEEPPVPPAGEDDKSEEPPFEAPNEGKTAPAKPAEEPEGGTKKPAEDEELPEPPEA